MFASLWLYNSGFCEKGYTCFADETIRQREKGMPSQLLVLKNCDEYVRCIDAETGKVVSWSRYDHDGVIEMHTDFYDYFLDEIENAIDNYDDDL